MNHVDCEVHVDDTAEVWAARLLFFLEVCAGVKKVNKGAWRMPWLMEAMKDVISCDKPR